MLTPHIKRKKCKKQFYILPHTIESRCREKKRKEEGRRISAEGRNPRLGLAGRISPVTRHLATGH
jgi:hypothetical protein